MKQSLRTFSDQNYFLFLKRWNYWRLSREELEYYLQEEETKEETEQKDLPEKTNLPELYKDPKKELLSNELVKDNPPLKAHISSETKEKSEKDIEPENLDESETKEENKEST